MLDQGKTIPQAFAEMKYFPLIKEFVVGVCTVDEIQKGKVYAKLQMAIKGKF